ncbi:hypothetical protein BFF78_27620 [Streptomyces fodineus]|uniref:Uncharacterized protein n=1 Tax=Streptomyces fodineus TaxID=1904616 RepID=A0A1D7YFC9_9ACTN|nr:hypothetical protein [Streptomyces fodineus]AOR34317.1 hypothetical protein BFF78_27620 [Streptomyces fodineus]
MREPAYGGASGSAQYRPAVAAPRARETVSALFAGVSTTAIVLGAVAGGRLAEGPGPTAVPVVGAGRALPAAAVDTAKGGHVTVTARAPGR